MKRYLLVCFVIGLAFAPVARAGEDPGTGIRDSCHDLCKGGQGCDYPGAADDPQVKLCVYCHTPHAVPEDAAASFLHYPIWSQAVTTLESFQTTTQDTDTEGQPGSISLICLSCHDGSVASNVYGYVPSGIIRFTGDIQAAKRILINKRFNASRHGHPIGFDYNEVATKDWDINEATSDLLGENAHNMTINDLLRNGRVECPSCHDVHNRDNEGRKLTWVEDYQSRLCLTCHKKSSPIKSDHVIVSKIE